MPTSPRKPSMYERASSAGIDAMIDRVAPAILELLAACGFLDHVYWSRPGYRRLPRAHRAPR